MRTIKFAILLLVGLPTSSNLSSQCMNQIFHSSGTTEINGIQVTVSSSGEIDTTTFCSDAQPYWIGGDTSGRYTFQFSPAIDSLTLNISSIHHDYSSNYEEIVIIDVNGNHYSIPSINEPNSCSAQLPILTTEGDLAALPNSEGAGSSGIVIPGPISEISVLDSIKVGGPGGVLFSIFICSEYITSNPEIERSDLLIYPIPTTEQITIKGLPNRIEEIYLLDNLGSRQHPEIFTFGNEANIDVSNISYGIYYVVIRTDERTITRKVIVGNN